MSRNLGQLIACGRTPPACKDRPPICCGPTDAIRCCCEAPPGLHQARLVGPAVEYWRDLVGRCDTELVPGHADALAATAQLAAAYRRPGMQGRPFSGTSGCWPSGAANSRPGIQLSPRRASACGREAFIMPWRPRTRRGLLLRAVSEYEQFRAPRHPDTLSARDELAAAYQAAGDLVAASRLLERALTDRECLQGSRDVQTMSTRDRLAAAYLAEGKVKDAVSHYKGVRDDCVKVLGPSHPDTIATSASLSVAYQAAGRMPAAMQLSEQCCADSERVLGPHHPPRWPARRTWRVRTTQWGEWETRRRCSAGPPCAASASCYTGTR